MCVERQPCSYYSTYHILVIPECRWSSFVLGGSPEHIRRNHRVFRLLGHAVCHHRGPRGQQTDRHIEHLPAGLCAGVLRHGPLVHGQQHQPVISPHRHDHQAGHHLPHSGTQREGLRASHTSEVATGWVAGLKFYWGYLGIISLFQLWELSLYFKK